MARPTNEELERRRQAALQTQNEQPAEESQESPPSPPDEPAPPPPPVPEIEMGGDEESPRPQPTRPVPQQQVFSPNAKDLEHYKKFTLESEKRKGTDAIAQAIKDAESIARAKIVGDPVTQALNADPASGRALEAFIKKFGPSNIKPPCPEIGVYGIKAEDYVRWHAMYDQPKFMELYKQSNSPLISELRKTIQV